jgi:hypothetical protein
MLQYAYSRSHQFLLRSFARDEGRLTLVVRTCFVKIPNGAELMLISQKLDKSSVVPFLVSITSLIAMGTLLPKMVLSRNTKAL